MLTRRAVRDKQFTGNVLSWKQSLDIGKVSGPADNEDTEFPASGGLRPAVFPGREMPIKSTPRASTATTLACPAEYRKPRKMPRLLLVCVLVISIIAAIWSQSTAYLIPTIKAVDGSSRNSYFPNSIPKRAVCFMDASTYRDFP